MFVIEILSFYIKKSSQGFKKIKYKSLGFFLILNYDIRKQKLKSRPQENYYKIQTIR
jgi:hypothetical protein